MSTPSEKILTVQDREAIEMMWRMGVTLEFQLPWTQGDWNTLMSYEPNLLLADENCWLNLKVRLKK